MTEVNLDPKVKANEPAGDDAGGNTEQAPMDVDENGRLKAPIDAADYVPSPGDNPFADNKAQAAAGKPTPAPEAKAPAPSPAPSKTGK